MGNGRMYRPQSIYFFFSKQSSWVANIIPMKWLNEPEKEGLAKGYWR